jgi:hypothetical protein
MSLYTEHRDGTPLAKSHWGPLPDPREAPDPARWPFLIITAVQAVVVFGVVALAWSILA